jgi:peptidoglycan/LPS O-acetylase OafA/YrhL
VIRFQATKPDGGQALASLQILRGLAALGVLAVHLSMVTDHVLQLRAYLPRLTLRRSGR